jgi:pimeloyl-ACP methyl ester carboxylesterase
MTNRLPFLAIVLQISVFAGFGQAKPIAYGNNPASGKYYSIRGFRMYCETYGEGKPLLMIHGNGGNMSAFTAIVPFFSKQYKVILADSRAQGKSTDGQDSLSFEMMADDFAALLDAMGIRQADVIGWSDGGINALLLAIRHPDKVKKLVSTGANLWPDSTAIIPSAWKGEAHYYDSLKNKVWTSAEEKNNWKIFILDWFQPNIPLSALESIRCPSLIMCGDHDIITLEHTVLIYQHIPNAYLWIVPHSGHATLIEHSEDFDRKVDQFLNGKL